MGGVAKIEFSKKHALEVPLEGGKTSFMQVPAGRNFVLGNLVRYALRGVSVAGAAPYAQAAKAVRRIQFASQKPPRVEQRLAQKRA